MNAHPILPCHVCDGRGYREFHDQFNPDGCTEPCDNCGGDGYEPWRAAGERYTGPKPAYNGVGYRDGDLLELLHAMRTENRMGWRYEVIRLRAMRPVSGLAQVDMLARATMCATAADRAAAAWRAVA